MSVSCALIANALVCSRLPRKHGGCHDRRSGHSQKGLVSEARQRPGPSCQSFSRSLLPKLHHTGDRCDTGLSARTLSDPDTTEPLFQSTSRSWNTRRTCKAEWQVRLFVWNTRRAARELSPARSRPWTKLASCRTHNRHALLLTSGSNRVSGRNPSNSRRAEDFHLPTQIRRMSAVDFVKGIKFIFFWFPSQSNIANFASRNFGQAASSSHHVSQRSCPVEPSKAFLAKTRTLRVWNPAVSCTFRRCVIPSANFSVSQP